MKNNIVIFKQIKFYNYSFANIFLKLKKGGYLVAPAASALADILVNKSYYNALGLQFQSFLWGE